MGEIQGLQQCKNTLKINNTNKESANEHDTPILRHLTWNTLGYHFLVWHFQKTHTCSLDVVSNPILGYMRRQKKRHMTLTLKAKALTIYQETHRCGITNTEQELDDKTMYKEHELCKMSVNKAALDRTPLSSVIIFFKKNSQNTEMENRNFQIFTKMSTSSTALKTTWSTFKWQHRRPTFMKPDCLIVKKSIFMGDFQKVKWSYPLLDWNFYSCLPC